MRLIEPLFGIVSCACLMTITTVLIASRSLIQRQTQIPVIQPAFIHVSEQSNAQWRVFEAVTDASWEIFLADDHTGQTWQLTRHFASDRFPTLSPDGRRVAFVSWRDGNPDIYIIDLATGTLANLSFHQAIFMALQKQDYTIQAVLFCSFCNLRHEC